MTFFCERLGIFFVLDIIGFLDLSRIAMICKDTQFVLVKTIG